MSDKNTIGIWDVAFIWMAVALTTAICVFACVGARKSVPKPTPATAPVVAPDNEVGAVGDAPGLRETIRSVKQIVRDVKPIPEAIKKAAKVFNDEVNKPQASEPEPAVNDCEDGSCGVEQRRGLFGRRR